MQHCTTRHSQCQQNWDVKSQQNPVLPSVYLKFIDLLLLLGSNSREGKWCVMWGLNITRYWITVREVTLPCPPPSWKEEFSSRILIFVVKAENMQINSILFLRSVPTHLELDFILYGLYCLSSLTLSTRLENLQLKIIHFSLAVSIKLWSKHSVPW